MIFLYLAISAIYQISLGGLTWYDISAFLLLFDGLWIRPKQNSSHKCQISDGYEYDIVIGSVASHYVYAIGACFPYGSTLSGMFVCDGTDGVNEIHFATEDCSGSIINTIDVDEQLNSFDHIPKG